MARAAPRDAGKSSRVMPRAERMIAQAARIGPKTNQGFTPGKLPQPVHRQITSGGGRAVTVHTDADNSLTVHGARISGLLAEWAPGMSRVRAGCGAARRSDP